ncbi:hypothetical protein K438DRAFT_1965188 [Mycena galopus ATCC 62051]|nr:hypothetical protein K438DRAFT_1965188 [Mycena galopus ATCC 62051]
MDEPTPVAPSRKRLHAVLDPTSDQEEDDEQLSANVFNLTSRNVTQILQRLGESKRLRPDQITDSINSVNEPPAVQGAKMILCLHALHNRIDAFGAGKPPFTVSEDTETNIYLYAAAILLSTKLSAYKGSVAKNILLDIVKVNRFDLPPNIERNPANYLRSKIKKALAASFKVKKEPAPSAREHQSIFDLTTPLVQGTKCAVTPELCARVALMRQVAFENILATDRATHGVDNYRIPTQTVDDVQREVDDTISAAAADKATSVPAAATTTALTEEPEETQDE